jgi:hypothetical protein
MQGGARYQNQVTAWLAAKMLAERPAAPIIPRGKLTYLAAESGEAVDDVLAGTDQGNFVFVQAKRKLSLSTREGSDLEGVVNQAVRQIAAAVEPDKRPWSRTLNPTRTVCCWLHHQIRQRRSEHICEMRYSGSAVCTPSRRRWMRRKTGTKKML